MMNSSRRLRHLLVGAILFVSTVQAFGQAQPPTAEHPWTTETLKSHALGKRTIFIATPAGYNAGYARYPVVVALDASDRPQFQLWIAQAAYLVSNGPHIPPMIFVGIANGEDRLHDMLPPATGASVKQFSTAGGASAFADFVIGEVLPYVRARYRTAPTTILAGHSAGGLFAVDVAAKRPGEFHGIIAMSPMIWFNDGTLVDGYADAIANEKERPRVFLTSGAGERGIEPTKRLTERLQNSGAMNGALAYRSYPDDEHSLTPLGFADGLRFVFDPISKDHLEISRLDLEKSSDKDVENVLQASERAYAAAARSLGLPETLPESVINGLGYRLLDEKKPALAVQLFKRNALAHPDSANVYDSLGDALLAAGDKAAALQQFRMSVEVAHRTSADVAPETERKLRELGGRK